MAARSGVRRAAGAEGGDAGSGPLEGARGAARDLRWLDAYEALRELDRRSALAVEDLELLATAAFLRGHGQECRQARLRAYQLRLHAGDVRGAARCAARIGLEQLSAGEVAEAAGCLPVSLSACSAWAAQAAALVEHEQEGAEHAYPLIAVAYEQLAMAGDPAAAAEVAARAAVLGRRYGDADLLALALTVQGRALVRSRRAAEGMMLLEEPVALAAAGALTPPVAGLVLTSAVDAGDEAFELGRCDEWTRALAGWCDEQDGMVTFRCRSLAHQAASAMRRGRWEEALQAADRACATPVAGLDTAAAAAARYVRAEVLRLRGDLPGAGRAYREAGELGIDPQPGLALLLLAQGDTAAAAASLDRALAEAAGGLDRARLLPARVEVLLAAGEPAGVAGEPAGVAGEPAGVAGEPAGAAEAARELEQIARDQGTAALEAAARQAGAAVLLAGGDPLAALTSARAACRAWRHLGLPYEQASARVLVATCCRVLGDEATAVLELEAACEMLARLGARPDLDRAAALLGRTAHAPAHGLTPRELEVLELLASGLTNRTIAEELHVTARTVDTHVSRILTKLGVPTRAAATSFAHRHDLV